VLRRYDAELDAAYEQTRQDGDLTPLVQTVRRWWFEADAWRDSSATLFRTLHFGQHHEELVTSGNMLAASFREPMDRMGQDRSQPMTLAAFVLVPRWCSAPPWTVSSPA
jgi:hypothetical protein